MNIIRKYKTTGFIFILLSLVLGAILLITSQKTQSSYSLILSKEESLAYEGIVLENYSIIRKGELNFFSGTVKNYSTRKCKVISIEVVYRRLKDHKIISFNSPVIGEYPLAGLSSKNFYFLLPDKGDIELIDAKVGYYNYEKNF